MAKGKTPAHLKAHQFKKGHVGGAAHPAYKPSLHRKSGAKKAGKMPAGLAKYLASRKKKAGK
jgi:hypothetical protein